MPREQKITFGEMREPGVFRIDIFRSDYRCSHSTRLSADRCPILSGCRMLSRIHLQDVWQAWR
jgi:hypothetical protein